MEPYEPPEIGSRGWRVGPAQHPIGVAAGAGAGLDVEFSVSANAAMDLATSDGAGVSAELLYTQLANFDMLPAAADGDGLSANNTLNIPVAMDLGTAAGDALVPTMSIITPFLSDDFNRTNNASPGASWTNRGVSPALLGITSNAAAPNISASNYRFVMTGTTPAPGDDFEITAIVGTVGANNPSLVITGGCNTSGEGVSAFISGAASGIQIVSHSAWPSAAASWSTTNQGTAGTATVAAADAFTFKRVGSTITISKNGGGALATWNDTTPTVPRDSSHRLGGVGTAATVFGTTVTIDSILGN